MPSAHDELLLDGFHDQLGVEIGSAGLKALLGIAGTEQQKGIVIFAHGSGSGRFSPRNGYVAERLRRAGFATLLLDLLTPAEEQDRRNVFDVELLAQRLELARTWAREDPRTRDLAIGYFGASTGAAAALLAAALPECDVGAVVSRGGRPDLAGTALAAVRAPTLLLVGGDDTGGIELNQAAFARLSVPKELVIIPGASHLFEEPGMLDAVVARAAWWFAHRLQAVNPRSTISE
jgi:putative phosphoribosyl transferase